MFSFLENENKPTLIFKNLMRKIDLFVVDQPSIIMIHIEHWRSKDETLSQDDAFLLNIRKINQNN
jgi:hypothetical protein